MNCLITGGAGFIGSHAVDRLLADGHRVVVYDNLVTGYERFLDEARGHPKYEFVDGDILDIPKLTEAMSGIDFVFHFAANADIRRGLNHPEKDLQQNTIGTFNVLDAMRKQGAKRIVFSSTAPVYGDDNIIPTPENSPFPTQTSLYGASKLAAEAFIQAFCEGYGMQCWNFRFVSLLGERYSHGVVYDFYKKLKQNPGELEILGDGTQRKSSLYIGDCIQAIMTAIEKADNKVNTFNLGTPEYVAVRDTADWICDYMGLKPEYRFTGGDRGWVGDNPFVFLDVTKIRSLGWEPELTIKEAVIKSLDYFEANPWVLERG